MPTPDSFSRLLDLLNSFKKIKRFSIRLAYLKELSNHLILEAKWCDHTRKLAIKCDMARNFNFTEKSFAIKY